MNALSLGRCPRRVDFVEVDAPAQPGYARCEIGRHIVFDTHHLESYLFAKSSPMVHDALLVAAAVEFCDRLQVRPAGSWRRDFELLVPVYEIDKWRGPVVLKQLVETLNFLTGDRWDIHFRRRKGSPAVSAQDDFEFPPSRRAVMPFSDGLDSWAVATLEDAKVKGLMRVRLGTAPAPKVPKGKSQPFQHVPYRVGFEGYRAAESSARSRGFKFALIGGIAAYLADVSDIIMPESGQSIIGSELIVSPDVEPDYRSHPRFTDKMESLIQALFGYSVNYLFPRIWSTKGETVRAAIAIDPINDAWTKTRTCWQNQRRVALKGKRASCGICAACLLRRVSLHHAEGGDRSLSPYVWNDLGAPTLESGAHPDFPKWKAAGKAFRKHAVAGTFFLATLAQWDSEHELPIKLAESARFVSDATGICPDACETGMRSLVRQHTVEWGAFLDTLGPHSFIANWARLL